MIVPNGVYLDFRYFPPTPERLISIVRSIGHADIGVFFFDFAELFPWSFGEAHLPAYAYTDQAIEACAKTVDDLDGEAVPVMSLFTDDDRTRYLKPFEHFRSPHEPDLDISVAGVSKAAIDMIEDLVSLFPDSTRVLIAAGKNGSLFDPHISGQILSKMIRASVDMGITLVIDSRIETAITSMPEAVERYRCAWDENHCDNAPAGTRWVFGTPSLLDDIASESAATPEWTRCVMAENPETGLEASLDSILSVAGTDECTEHTRSSGIRRSIERIDSQRRNGWRMVGKCREEIVRGIHDSPTAEASFHGGCETLQALEQVVEEIASEINSLESSFENGVNSRWFELWRRRVLEPLYEEVSMLRPRLQQISKRMIIR